MERLWYGGGRNEIFPIIEIQNREHVVLSIHGQKRSHKSGAVLSFLKRHDPERGDNAQEIQVKAAF